MEKVSLQMVKNSLPKRDDSFHKGKNGKVLIIAGSNRYPTTGTIVGKSSMRAGAGLVTVATSTFARQIISPSLMEVMTISYEDEILLSDMIENSDTIAIGCGINKTATGENLIKKVLSYDKKIIVDADGIFHLKKFLDMLKGKDILITPHEGEFSYLLGVNPDNLSKNRCSFAKSFAKEYSIKVLLKGKNTIITDGKNAFYLDKGSYKMATGGMGDCLTGIIASISASGTDLFDSAIAAAYIHSYTADLLSENMYTVLATDVIEKLPYVINDIKEN